MNNDRHNHHHLSDRDDIHEQLVDHDNENADADAAHKQERRDFEDYVEPFLRELHDEDPLDEMDHFYMGDDYGDPYEEYEGDYEPLYEHSDLSYLCVPTSIYRVTSEVSDPWEGSFEELMEVNPEVPEHTRRRIQSFAVNEAGVFQFPNEFRVERIR